MKAILEDEEKNLTITNEDFNIRGWVHIELNGEETDIYLSERYIDIHLSEIYPVVKSFYDKYINELKEDKLK